MEVRVFNKSTVASDHGAEEVLKLVHSKPQAIIGFATGSTPLKVYREILRRHKSEHIDFSQMKTFNLSEYIGLPKDHVASCRQFMNQNLFNHINVTEKYIHIPDGLARNIPEACQKYEENINAAGGIDLQLLGLGAAGHIGFNEPTSSLASRTRMKTLTQVSRQDNAHYFKDISEVPQHCITMGIATIMECKRIVLLAFGENKASAVAKMIEGPLSAMVPASILQMHPNVLVLLDRAAAAELTHTRYYFQVSKHKPNWQK